MSKLHSKFRFVPIYVAALAVTFGCFGCGSKESEAPTDPSYSKEPMKPKGGAADDGTVK